MVRAVSIGRQALRACDLVKALQSEIRLELSTDRFQSHSAIPSPSDFSIEHDSPSSQDILLRKKSKCGEELVVSSLLTQNVVNNGEEEDTDTDALPREALMKVCVSKPGVSSILQFNCGVSGRVGGAELDVKDVFLWPSSSAVYSTAGGKRIGSVYRGPPFKALNSRLCDELRRFLIGRGIDEGFRSWLLLYLHRKEQGQYVDWLKKIEAFAMPDVQVETEARKCDTKQDVEGETEAPKSDDNQDVQGKSEAPKSNNNQDVQGETEAMKSNNNQDIQGETEAPISSSNNSVR